jgi:chemosensory pili system protein ChpE
MEEGSTMTAALGFMLGLVYVASPGPVNVETLRRGLTGGVRPALALQLGALAGDLLWVVLALAGVGLLLTHALAQTILGVAGMALLLCFGWSALWSQAVITAVTCSSASVETSRQTAPVGLRRTVWTGVAIATANPLAPIFWVSVSGSLGESTQQPLAFLGGFAFGALLAGIGIALLVGLWHARLTPRLVRAVTSGCGLVLLGYGLLVGYTTVLGA